LEQRRGREEGLGELAQTVSTDLLALLAAEARVARASGRRWRRVGMATGGGVTHFTV
jgi:hypothetical protein